MLVAAGAGLLHLFTARPDRHSADIPEGDAREVAQQLEQMRRGGRVAAREETR